MRLQWRRPVFNPWVRKIPWGGHGNPLQYSCLENSMDREALWSTAQGSHIVGHNWATNTHNLRELLFLGTTIWYVSGAASLKKIWQYIPNRGYTCYYPTIPFLVVKHTEKPASINKKACTRMSIIAFIQIYIYHFNKRMTKYKHLIISRREPRL